MQVTVVVSLAVIALALDAVDGWVARRTRTTRLGARFDAEVDAFLILVLSVYVARSAGAWVLAIGAARYAFLAAGWALPWLREPLPPRYWRKVVAATQGIVLTIAAADVLPPTVTEAALVAALVLLAESFGRDVWWLWRHRHATHSRAAAGAAPTLDLAVATPAGPGRGRLRTGIAAALTTLALLLVWGALVAPDKPIRLTPSAFVRLPLEGLVLIAVAVVLPATARRLLAGVVGPLLALVVILKILDLAFFATFDRPFDPYQDVSYAGIGIETLRKSRSVGQTRTWSSLRWWCSWSPYSSSRPWRCVGSPGSRPTTAAGHSGPSRRSALSGCSVGCSARNSCPTRPSPPRAPPAWSWTR